MLAQANLDRIRSIPKFLEELIDAVTEETYGYDMRMPLREIRLVPDQDNPRRMVIGVSCEGTPSMTLYLELDEEDEADS